MNQLEKSKQSSRNRKIFTIYLVVILLLGSFIAGLYLGRSKFVQKNLEKQTANLEIENKYSDKTEQIDFQLFWKVWDIVDKKFIDELDYQRMLYGATSGMVASLQDPYTIFMDPKASVDFQEEIEGTFEGIGAEIGIKNEQLTIIAPLSSSPAEKAGIKAKDIILKIDGEETKGMSLIEAVSKIRGERGTQVTLTVIRDEFDEPQDFVITRETIEIESVKWELRKKGEKDIAYIELSHFGEDTPEKFKEIITDVLSRGIDGIILDLRNNTGGFLESSIEVASEFLSPEKVVAIESFSDGRKNEFKSQNGSRLTNIATAVLINEGTASASEIVAGALRDQRGIKLIGKKTFGKGSVQELEKFDDGSSLRISIAEWLTPSGKNINGEGLNPDIEVELTDEDYDKDRDPQLEKALEVILGN
jgi:carboxyl-terminal processing protease